MYLILVTFNIQIFTGFNRIGLPIGFQLADDCYLAIDSDRLFISGFETLSNPGIQSDYLLIDYLFFISGEISNVFFKFNISVFTIQKYYSSTVNLTWSPQTQGFYEASAILIHSGLSSSQSIQISNINIFDLSGFIWIF